MAVLDESVATNTGIRAGDRILRINGHSIEDELDVRFYGAGDRAVVEVEAAQGGRCRLLRLTREEVRDLGFEPMRARRCRNCCIFCFVDQLPGGLRQSLYVKDEDYRFSFLYGNYVTLASVRDDELERICRLKLRPLYVSVHATDPGVRNFLLGRKASRDIMDTLRVLADCGIVFHTQVVLCPGLNEGKVLEKTIQDLALLYPAVASIAIVPVGLTRYRRGKGFWPIRAVNTRDSTKIIKQVRRLQLEFKVKYNNCLVFLSDEFYRKANCPFPSVDQYGELPQWENGVGMIPLFYRQWECRKRRKPDWAIASSPDLLAITGELAYPHVLAYVQWLRTALGAPLRLFPVKNRFFGRHVNVTGLVTGQDVIKQIRPRRRPKTVLLVPDVMVSAGEGRFLDDVSLQEVGELLSVRVEKFSPDPVGFEEVLKRHARRL